MKKLLSDALSIDKTPESQRQTENERKNLDSALKGFGFGSVFKTELNLISNRRRHIGLAGQPHPSGDLVGLCLSGGGIRSATFCLGLLQGLRERGVLPIFDYLSTVSGGGYVGGWWSAWLARPSLGGQDLTNARSFIAKLKSDSHPYSLVLRSRLSMSVQERLSNHNPEEEPPAFLIDELLGELSEVLKTCSLRDPAHQDLESDETKKQFEIAEGEGQLFWANRALLSDAYRGELRCDCFPPPEGIVPSRPEATRETESAWSDPIHHLRLYGNYLTPRRGLFSSDTWRAIAVATRNITMSWLVLLPMLVAIVLAGQLYFVFQENAVNNFIKPAQSNSKLRSGESNHTPAEDSNKANENPLTSKEARTARLWFAAKPLFAIGGWITVMGIAWLYFTVQTNQRRDRLITIAGTSVVVAVLGWAIIVFGKWAVVIHWWQDDIAWHITWMASGVVLLAYALRHPNTIFNPRIAIGGAGVVGVILGLITGLINALFLGVLLAAASLAYVVRWFQRAKGRDVETMNRVRAPRRPEEERQIHDLWRNQITLVHSRLLAAFAIVAVVLLISGFGHEIVGAFRIKEGFWNIPRETVSWIALVSSFLGSLFTVLKVRPRGGEDIRDTGEPNAVSRMVLALTPPLVVVVLAVVAAWAGHSLLIHFENHKEAVHYLTYLISFSAPLYFMLAVFEMNPTHSLKNANSIVMLGWLIIPLFWLVRNVLSVMGTVYNQVIMSLAAVAILCAIFTFSLLRIGRRGTESTKDKIMDWVTVVSLMVLAGVCDFGKIDFTDPATNSTRVAGLGLLVGFLRNEKLQHVWLLILPLLIALLVGGLVTYRWMIAEHASNPRTFKLTRFKRLNEHDECLLNFPEDQRVRIIELRRKDGLWILGSVCIVVATAAFCLIYHLVAVVNGKAVQHSRWLYVGLVVFATAFAGAVFAYRKALLGIRDQVSARQTAHQTAEASTIPPEEVKESETTTEVVRRRLSILKYLKQPRFVVRAMPIAWVLLAVGIYLIAAYILRQSESFRPNNRFFTSLSFAVIVLCFIYIRFEMKLSTGKNGRSLFLITCAYITMLDVLFVSFIPKLEEHESILYVHVVIGLIATALAWVVGLGWMADPNAFSMHAFYKTRLTRAYLGASNLRRNRQRKQITEPSTDDDLPLKDLKNTDKGAPYHLINTTLNLVAARDLATAQRSAASFVLSQSFCGSSRTGYRGTSEFMDGRLTLGTAVAISGAAASPNMGTRTPSAALAMLMTLLNVRLGYWAPTPNKPFWRDAQTRLWPFYLCREFLSHTNELSDYCYLTDGGHFDNTGLYSLVERGCRFIVMADCGADPKSSFSDLGEVIRRCRIDFRAEIKLDLSQFMGDGKAEDKKGRKQPLLPFSVGSITYSNDHLAALRKASGTLVPGKQIPLEGTIILCKPTITGGELADIRQYGRDNPVFPQQSTTNQWFGEAQFESYRRLGEFCAQKAFPSSTSIQSRADVNKLFLDISERFRAVIAERECPTASSSDNATTDAR